MVAFAVLAHDDPAQLHRLLSVLADHPVSVHLDAATDAEDYESRARLSSFPQAEYVVDRSPVRWGGYSVVEAMMSAALAASAQCEDGDHIVFLSGHCYPIRPISEVVEHLRDAPWRVHARAYELADGGPTELNRVRQRHGFDREPPRGLRSRHVRRVWRVARRSLTPPLTLEGSDLNLTAGSQWMALPRACALEAVDALAEDPRYRIFRDSFAPDEMAFQTFVYSTRWKDLTRFGAPEPPPHKISGIPNLHLLDTEMKGQLSIEQLEASQTSAFFARKFYSATDSETLDRLDRHVLRQAR